MLPRAIYLLLICCGILLAVVCGLLLFIGLNPGQAKEDGIAVCGNTPVTIDDDDHPGKLIFQDNCITCHFVRRDAAGPALASVVPQRSPEWICKFLTKPKFNPQDSIANSYRATWNASCMKFPQLTCSDVEKLVRYITKNQ